MKAHLKNQLCIGCRVRYFYSLLALPRALGLAICAQVLCWPISGHLKELERLRFVDRGVQASRAREENLNARRLEATGDQVLFKRELGYVSIPSRRSKPRSFKVQSCSFLHQTRRLLHQFGCFDSGMLRCKGLWCGPRRL